VHHAVHLAELSHRGEIVHHALRRRAGYRRRRWLASGCQPRAPSASARRGAGATSAPMWMCLAFHEGT
jgi:hypothetical protein